MGVSWGFMGLRASQTYRGFQITSEACLGIKGLGVLNDVPGLFRKPRGVAKEFQSRFKNRCGF